MSEIRGGLLKSPKRHESQHSEFVWDLPHERLLMSPSMYCVALCDNTNVDQNLRLARVASSSVFARESHACQDASHIGEAGDHARHRIVGMTLVFQIAKALVSGRDEGFKHLPHRHDALSHRDLTLLALKVGEILHVYVKHPRTCFMDRLNHVRARANRMPDIDAAADARIHALHRLQNIQRRMPQLILGAMIVDRDADVGFLYECLDTRQRFQLTLA